MSPWQRNLHLIRLVRICFALIFCASVITLFWQKYGLDLVDIFWLQAIFALAIVLFEIPTGYLADRMGRKKTLVLACLIGITAWGYYAFADTFWEFVVAELALGLGFSFLSGTDTSLVYESLHALHHAQDFTAVEGKQQGAAHLAEACAALCGGWMILFLPIEATLLASAAILAIALLASLRITEPERTPYAHPRGTWYGLYKIARFVFLKSRTVRIAVPLLALCSLATMLGVWLYQPFWQQKNIPVWAFGMLWAALSLPSSLASHFAGALEKKLGPHKTLWLLPLPALVGYLVLAWAPGGWALSGAYLVNLLRGFALPVLGKYIHEETYSDKRATVMSIQSWIMRLLYFFLGPLIGMIGRDWGITRGFIACALIGSAGIVLYLPALSRRIRTLPAD